MNRRAFMTGLLSTTAVIAAPVPIGGLPGAISLEQALISIRDYMSLWYTDPTRYVNMRTGEDPLSWSDAQLDHFLSHGLDHNFPAV